MTALVEATAGIMCLMTPAMQTYIRKIQNFETCVQNISDKEEMHIYTEV